MSRATGDAEGRWARLGLFVHRVNGLAPGLYALARDAAKLDALREIMRPDFLRGSDVPSA
ncbi:MAG: hypothetical protein EHM78_06785 [Myxococcaceae bacterium]|nr:MAG: hypothetical protein EHM78_06785 [Myxococcaceae bacterium]